MTERDLEDRQFMAKSTPLLSVWTIIHILAKWALQSSKADKIGKNSNKSMFLVAFWAIQEVGCEPHTQCVRQMSANRQEPATSVKSFRSAASHPERRTFHCIGQKIYIKLTSRPSSPQTGGCAKKEIQAQMLPKTGGGTRFGLPAWPGRQKLTDKQGLKLPQQHFAPGCFQSINLNRRQPELHGHRVNCNT